MVPTLIQVHKPTENSDDNQRGVLEKMLPGSKAYERYFNGQLRLLISPAGGSAAEQQAKQAAVATNLIHGLLGKCPLIKVYRIHKGGSFGRRTLVSGAHDVDLSVFVIKFQERALNYEDWSGEAGERLQRDMQRAVAAYLRGQEELHDVVEVEHGTHYKHCVNLKVHGVDMDIKMTAIVPLGGNGGRDNGKAQRDVLMQALWDTPPHLRQADPAREAALAEALTAVVKEISDRIKFVARLVKCWYKNSLQRYIPYVPSVLLETVVLAAAQRKGLLSPGKQESGAEVAVFLAALELLDAAVTRREVVLLEAGPVWGYTRAQAESCRHVWRNDPVVVLHPIDPTCNLAACPQPDRAVDWSALAAAARALRRVVRDCNMLELVASSSLAAAIRVQLAP
ncbi:hypothetical protein CHLRE_13g605550v5 [Chlamydomonas reinhardtii]|uniref:2'-5'-oligoadenylate synthetase 1 domain-containing protein n=1 Tax=Chlamydomonas reinhardtii TaxID=3055 RepID=A0A2K3D1H7_CHLRE|nr:uncharacterized protein CHLRE_13g605550v5 [Chlamydomonas reinhardtii]PNW74367.1 hypothetical protein CHLRE_13g605550v5 [Chlamydomonas reinhardtii]